MEPTSISATAVKAFMECPAHYKAQYLEKVRINTGGGSAGDMGSAVHDVLEWFVTTNPMGTLDELTSKVKELAPNYGLDALQIRTASKLVSNWYQRWCDDDTAFEVLQAEVKETFPLGVKEPSGRNCQTLVTYIWDRVDKLTDGSIRVVDYKTWMKYMTPDEMFNDIQVRMYALAAAVRYKDDKPANIWVGLDQLRYGQPVFVCFDRDAIKEIWQWLRGVYLKILASDGTEEKVGNACRWCVRSPECKSFNAAVIAGTVMLYKTPQEAATKVAEINLAVAALKDIKDHLLVYLDDYLKEQNTLEQRFENGVLVKITPKNKREINQQAAVEAIGPELAARYGKLGVTVVDELLAGDELSEDQKMALKRAVTEGMTTSTNTTFK